MVTDSPQTARTWLQLLGHFSNNICSRTHQTTHEMPTGMASSSLYTTQAQSEQMLHNARQAKGFCKMMDKTKEHLYRISFPTKDSNNHHRCLPSRLGNASTQQHSPMQLVHIRVQPAYKSARAKNSVQHMQSLSTTNQGQSIRILTDQWCACFIKTFGRGLQSLFLCMEVMLLWNWCISHDIHISAS